jgi:predicted  nucleic acid-binding Zn-ribbon protein
MSLDWGKIEQKKDKDHKVRGSVLLEMKEKLASQEKELLALKENVSSLNGKTQGMQVSLESTIKEKDKQIKDLMEEKNDLQNKTDTKIASLQGEIEALNSAKTTLEGDLEAARAELSGFEALKKERDELAKNVETLEDDLRGRDFDYFKKYVKEKSARASQTFEQKSQSSQENDEQ